MKQDVQLYIEGQRIDLFEDESLQITSSIQNIKSIDKVFTDYSQSFSVKASRNNNLIFKHYHDPSIVNGYDARFRSNAVIEINHQKFRSGTIALTNVQMKNNRAYAYDLTFYGSTVTLANLLGEDKLDVLTYLNNYNHTWNSSNVSTGLTSTYGVSTLPNYSVIYPLMSAKNRFIYDSVSLPTIENTRNIANDTFPSIYAGVHQEDLKPAIRVKHIIEAIEDRYPQIVFSDDFFNDTDFTDLYLWLHREKGTMFEEANEATVLAGDYAIDVNTINCPSDYVTLNSKSFTFTAINFANETRSLSAQLTVTPVSALPYNIEIVDVNNDNEVLYSANNLTTLHSHTIVLDGNGISTREYNIEVYITRPYTSALASVDVAWQTTTSRTTIAGTCNNYKNFSISSALSLFGDVIITSHVPDIKIIDFLTGLFKMFNLTAYVGDDNVIVVKTLDEFYSDGTSYDITKYVNVEESSVKRVANYSELEYKFQSPSTLLAKRFADTNNKEFGSQSYKVVNDFKHIDGTKYSVALPFEKVIYERLTDDNDNSSVNIQYGLYVDDNLNTIKGKPLLFYKVYTGVSGDYIYYKPFTDDSATQVSTYNRPSNVKSDSSQTLNFDAENDEFALTYNYESLFKNYHINYISSVFDYRNRMLNVKAVLPLNILVNYKLNDRFIIGDRQYKINSITSNLLDNKSDLELIEDL